MISYIWMKYSKAKLDKTISWRQNQSKNIRNCKVCQMSWTK